ncbi:MAG TPA: hypothetical protein VNW28_01965 [Chthoniobacterales bacterium]|nr:hypothetical protein [Chthoniobacterales bacterium]
MSVWLALPPAFDALPLADRTAEAVGLLDLSGFALCTGAGFFFAAGVFFLVAFLGAAFFAGFLEAGFFAGFLGAGFFIERAIKVIVGAAFPLVRTKGRVN